MVTRRAAEGARPSSSGKPEVVVEQIAVFGGTKRLLQTWRAVLAYREQAFGETSTYLAAESLEALPHRFGDSTRQTLSRERRKLPCQPLRLGILDVHTHPCK